jgi:hypothetical protein
VYLEVMGHLVDITISRIGKEILELRDITEIESIRLGELLDMVKTLEEIFVIIPEEVSRLYDGMWKSCTDVYHQPSRVVAQVPHWLKFCYISEILVCRISFYHSWQRVHQGSI